MPFIADLKLLALLYLLSLNHNVPFPKTDTPFVPLVRPTKESVLYSGHSTFGIADVDPGYFAIGDGNIMKPPPCSLTFSKPISSHITLSKSTLDLSAK